MVLPPHTLTNTKLSESTSTSLIRLPFSFFPLTFSAKLTAFRFDFEKRLTPYTTAQRRNIKQRCMCSLHCQKFERKRKKRMFLNFYCLNILAGAKILSDLKHRTQYNIVFFNYISVKFISRLHQVGMFLFCQVNPIFPWRGLIYIFLSTVSLNEAWNKFVYFLWKQLNKQKRNWNSSLEIRFAT